MALDLMTTGERAYLTSDAPLPADPVQVRYHSGPGLLEIDYGEGAPAHLLDREVEPATRPKLESLSVLTVLVLTPAGGQLEGWDVPLTVI